MYCLFCRRRLFCIHAWSEQMGSLMCTAAHRIILTAVLFLASDISFAKDSWGLRARVLNVSTFPSEISGLIRTWVSIIVEGNEGSKQLELLMVYVSVSQEMPRLGDECLFNVHRERVGGFVGKHSVDTHDAVVVDSFHCDVRSGVVASEADGPS